MSRLLTRVVWDFRLQFRNGFYYAAAAVVFFFTILLVWVPAEAQPWFLPTLIFTNLLTNGFYFIGGLVLLEKGEGSLEAQTVTPLRDWEYLTAKVVTLSTLSLIESAVLVLLAQGVTVNWAALATGVLMTAATLSCLGLLLVARYDSINEYLFPSAFVTFLLSGPMPGLLDVWHTPLFWLHPMHPSLVLLRAAFQPLPGSEVAAALLVGAFWLSVSFALCRRDFHRFVVAREGAR